ncbi:1,4-dihydroxy-2-naphtoate octaprenyl transferase [Wenjunlia vitaminophila]|uniref:1,4-dihydroxy-2-naphtoate octaprenyl transferase n=1 Tax=Wenjunlia vitaminophila TaxID=76728 RepID=A0A0T6LUC4_WENVI|nr:prenyltransferase [Wenjunlia vitaminophila]KRV49747.1 1,4-dihydroxy-2-naphtoate octaprenyl transferase [Wenjunlia vitaminophila]
MTTTGTLGAVVRLARVKFLFQSLLVVGLGVTVAVHETGAFSPRWYVVTVAFAWVTHLMTHFSNDYFDLEADRANPAPTSWTGGSRVLVDGLLPPVAGLGAAFVLLFTGVGLTAVMPTPSARLTAAALTALAWFYTAPPARLNYRAMGEATCAVVLYGIGPVLAALLQAGPVSGTLLGCTAVVCALQVARCLVMNLCDIEGDTRVGKLTLAGALGPRRAVRAYVATQAVVHPGVVLLALAGYLPVPAALAVLVLAPVPWWVTRLLVSGAARDPERAESVALWSSVQLPFTSCALSLGLLADMLARGRPIPGAWGPLAVATVGVFALWLLRTLRRGRPRTGTGAPSAQHPGVRTEPTPAPGAGAAPGAGELGPAPGTAR